MLVYDCYNNEIEIMTVKTYNEAQEWKAKEKNNRVKERLIDYFDSRKGMMKNETDVNASKM